MTSEVDTFTDFKTGGIMALPFLFELRLNPSMLRLVGERLCFRADRPRDLPPDLFLFAAELLAFEVMMSVLGYCRS